MLSGFDLVAWAELEHVEDLANSSLNQLLGACDAGLMCDVGDRAIECGAPACCGSDRVQLSMYTYALVIAVS